MESMDKKKVFSNQIDFSKCVLYKKKEIYSQNINGVVPQYYKIVESFGTKKLTDKSIFVIRCFII